MGYHIIISSYHHIFISPYHHIIKSSYHIIISSFRTVFELALEPLVRMRLDRAGFGTARQNASRSSWLWNRSSECVSIELALEPIVRMRTKNITKKNQPKT